jgi:carboxyl-terminal processing protease
MKQWIKILMSLVLVCPVAGSAQVPPQTLSEEDKYADAHAIPEIIQMVQFLCNEIYPRPGLAECIDRVKHGIMSAGDPHTSYLNSKEIKAFNESMSGRFVGVGMEIIKPDKNAPIIVQGVIPGSPAEMAGILPGDIVSHVIEIEGEQSTIPMTIDAFVAKVRGTEGTTAQIRIMRSGVSDPIDFRLVRRTVTLKQVQGELLVQGGKSFAVLRSIAFRERHHDDLAQLYFELLKKANGKLDGVILSLENNPGGSLPEADSTARLFTANTDSVVLMRDNVGVSPYTLPSGYRALHRGDITKGLPLLIIVNERSASASEIVAGYLQHTRRGVVAGTAPTFGKGVVQAVNQFYGGALKWTSSEYLVGTPQDWINVQCVGIHPDILFTYEGVSSAKQPIRECELTGHVGTKGPMVGAKPKPAISVSNPKAYAAILDMKRAWVAHRSAQLEKERALQETLPRK